MSLKPAPPTRVYRAVNACIYCGSAEDLTDEHIVPYALGGNLLLPQASCKACTTVTAKLENICSTMFGLARTKLQLPTRNKKKRLKVHPMKVVRFTDKEANIEMPTDELPPLLMFLRYQPPRALSGLPEFTTDLAWKPWYYPPPDVLAPLLIKHQIKRVRDAFQFKPWHFNRVLAKISHGLAVAELGLGGFQQLLPDLILAKKRDTGHLIGCPYEDDPPGIHTNEFQLNEVQVDEVRYLVTRLRLFSRLGAPVYHVVTGILSKDAPALTYPEGGSAQIQAPRNAGPKASSSHE